MLTLDDRYAATRIKVDAAFDDILNLFARRRRSPAEIERIRDNPNTFVAQTFREEGEKLSKNIDTVRREWQKMCIYYYDMITQRFVFSHLFCNLQYDTAVSCTIVYSFSRSKARHSRDLRVAAVTDACRMRGKR